MKKDYFIYHISIMLIVFFSAVTAIAQTETSSPREEQTYRGKILLGLNGGFGITYPGGDIVGTGDQKALPGIGYSFGLSCSYMFMDLAGVALHTEYTGKIIESQRTFLSQLMEKTTRMSYVDIALGYKGIYKILYFELGGFIGIKTGTWTRETVLSGNSTETEIDGDVCHNEAGIYLAAGCMFAINELINIDVGVKFKSSFLYGYENETTGNDDKLKTNIVMLTTGITFKI
ncbi:MAG: hypothetical protein GY757_23995 [bacterium]|nr:hypothetical protein [bacterium]